MIFRSINSLLQKSYCTQDFITKHNWHRKKKTKIRRELMRIQSFLIRM